MSYIIVEFTDPNDDQPTVAVFNEDRSRVSVCTDRAQAFKSVRNQPNLDCAVAELLDERDVYPEYAAAVDVALKGESEPFKV